MGKLGVELRALLLALLDMCGAEEEEGGFTAIVGGVGICG